MLSQFIARFKARQELRRVERELEAARSKFELVGHVKANYSYNSFLGGRATDRAYAYLYQNAKGERKVEISDPDLREEMLALPAVVYFLAGKSSAEIEAIAPPRKAA